MLGNGPLDDDPYSIDWMEDALAWRWRERIAFTVPDPRAQISVSGITEHDAFIRDLVLVVDDPALRWVSSWREFGQQLVDIVRHEVAIARGCPASSPGARWVTAESFVDGR